MGYGQKRPQDQKTSQWKNLQGQKAHKSSLGQDQPIF